MIRRINLVPASARPRTRTDFGGLALLVLCILCIAGAVISYVYYDGVLAAKEAELSDLEAQVALTKKEVAALDQYDELENQRRETEGLVQYIYAHRTLVSQTLGDVSLVIPKEAWLQRLSLTAPAVPPMSDQGAAKAAATSTAGTFDVAGTTFTFEDVSTLLVRLREVPSLTDIALGQAVAESKAGATTGTSKNAGTGLVTFQLRGGLINTQSADAPLPVSQVQVRQ